MKNLYADVLLGINFVISRTYTNFLHGEITRFQVIQYYNTLMYYFFKN